MLSLSSIRNAVNDLLFPVVEPGDLLPALPADDMQDDDFNAVMWIGLYDYVEYRADCVRYEGVIVDVDYMADRALVWVTPDYQFWAGVERLTVLYGTLDVLQ
jgi:hypothetical protein